MSQEQGMTYGGTGVDYGKMDPFKRMAQIAGLETAKNLARHWLREFQPSRGESAYIIETPDCFLAHVEEGLGTKNLVADAMQKLTGVCYYGAIAQDTVAMIVNDIITVGALPISVAMHLAVGNSDWFKDEVRTKHLVNGWKKACNMANCVWGGGETPTLKGIVNPETAVLAGSAMGIIRPKSRILIGNKICHGDAIIMINSSGIHANCLTMAREIADKLPQGYLTLLTDGRTYGESLLDPTIIYVRLIEECFDRGVDIHYAVHITGHGWRKLMRAVRPFTYIIECMPNSLPIFEFIQKHGPVSDEEAYGNLNMGAGFALYVPQSQVHEVFNTANTLNLQAFQAGHIERGEKKVEIRPKNIVFQGDTLAVR